MLYCLHARVDSWKRVRPTPRGARTDRENRRSRPGSSALRKNGICGHGWIVFAHYFCAMGFWGVVFLPGFVKDSSAIIHRKSAKSLPLPRPPLQGPLTPPPEPSTSIHCACSGRPRAIFLRIRTSRENFPPPPIHAPCGCLGVPTTPPSPAHPPSRASRSSLPAEGSPSKNGRSPARLLHASGDTLPSGPPLPLPRARRTPRACPLRADAALAWSANPVPRLAVLRPGRRRAPLPDPLPGERNDWRTQSPNRNKPLGGASPRPRRRDGSRGVKEGRWGAPGWRRAPGEEVPGAGTRRSAWATARAKTGREGSAICGELHTGVPGKATGVVP